MRAVRVPRYGEVWSVGPPPSTLKLAAEVDAYFELGVTVPSGGLVVDVGANVGMFALATAARSEGVRFVSIEPIDEIFEALATNFRRHPLLSSRAHRLMRAAITSDPSERSIRLSYFSRFPSDTTRYLDAKHGALSEVFAAEGRKIGDRLARHFGARAVGALAERAIASLPNGALGRWASDRSMGRKDVQARATTLASVLRDEGTIDLLKIDVEGAELDVLESLDVPTWARVRRVVMESNERVGPAKLGALLASRGLTQQRTLVLPRVSFGAVGDFLIDARR